MIKWLKNVFLTENTERQENMLNSHAPQMIQVDNSLAKKQEQVRKVIDNQLETAHWFASIPHEPGCHVLHETDASLDCHGECNWQFTPDKKVGDAYIVTGRQSWRVSQNAVKEKDPLKHDWQAIRKPTLKQ